MEPTYTIIVDEIGGTTPTVVDKLSNFSTDGVIIVGGRSTASYYTCTFILTNLITIQVPPVELESPVPKKPKPYPEKKGKGGKIKRW